jgi:diguanylate cyclase (GGDEF)-like protein
VYRSYYRWLRASRLIMAAFLTLAALFLVWVLPWLPSGLDTADYSSNVAFTIYLLAILSATGMTTLVVREQAWRKRESLMVWTAVYDEATGLHNRTYLFDRISLECERAERMGGVFSLFVLGIWVGGVGSGSPPTVSDTALQRVAEFINRLSRPTDLVALLSRSELAVLMIGVDREKRAPLLERIRATVVAELPALLDRPASIDVIGGASTYAVEGKEAASLIQAARAAATLALPHRAGDPPPSAKKVA